MELIFVMWLVIIFCHVTGQAVQIFLHANFSLSWELNRQPTNDEHVYYSWMHQELYSFWRR